MTLSDFTRWLYRGQRPNWIARILNRATATVASSGVAANYLETLEVTGRKSGRTFSDTLRSQKAMQQILSQFNKVRNLVAHSCVLNDDEIIRFKLLVKDWFRIQS